MGWIRPTRRRQATRDDPVPGACTSLKAATLPIASDPNPELDQML